MNVLEINAGIATHAIGLANVSKSEVLEDFLKFSIVVSDSGVGVHEHHRDVDY